MYDELVNTVGNHLPKVNKANLDQMPVKISIRVAQSEDHDAVLEFIREFYYKEEPITVSHPQPGHTQDDEAFTMSFISLGTTLVAVDDDSGTIVGALSAGPIQPGDADEMIEEAATTETKKWRDIMLLLAFIEKKADVLERFNLPKALHVHALGVHHGYRGQKIGEKLFNFCFENAKRLNYSMVTTDFTSAFSIKIGERLGMEHVSTVTYDEYNASLGESLFQPIAPNFEIKTFVKTIK